MDDRIPGIAKALKLIANLLQDPEERLQKLERAMSPKGHLRQIERFIEDIQDPVKREAAMAEFAALCHALGIENLEEEP